MKKLTIYILAMFFVNTTFAQKTISVTYNHISYLGSKYDCKLHLVANEDYAIYEYNNNNKSSENFSYNINEKSFKHNPKSTYYLTNLKNKEIKYYRRYDPFVDGHFALVTDLPKINWKLEKATQIISGLTCNKATAYFRGRNYTAWFAPSLPYSIGPWKFCGLPGLIVKISNKEKETNIIASKIEFIDDFSIDTNIHSYAFKKYDYKELNLREFVILSDEASENKQKEMKESFRDIPGLGVGKRKRYGRELIYEWDSEKKVREIKENLKDSPKYRR